jgi:hypothetical protein
VAFIAYLHVLAWPTAAFGWMIAHRKGRAAMERLEEIFSGRRSSPDRPLQRRTRTAASSF